MNTARIARRIVSRHLKATRRKLALRVQQLLAMMKLGKHFGVLSAYGTGSKAENKRLHSQLIRDLQAMGYTRWEPLRGHWEGVAERSILVPGMQAQDVFALGRKYKQDAVIYKSNKGVIGMYYFDGPHAVIAADPKGTPLYEYSNVPDSELYSKARGLRFEFGFVWTDLPWNGRTPLTPRDIAKAHSL